MFEQALPPPGLIVLFGSGETSPSGRKIFDRLLQRLPPSPRIALLETPAGFELNSSQVIQRVGDFIEHRLRNFSPRLEIVPARKRGTAFSPDNPSIVDPLLHADLIFMGPGSPSYAIRQLSQSLAWYYLLASHRLGAALALASAAVVAISAYSLPVYEIYKVGEDLHWIDGLNLFGYYGLQLVFIPHWNNQEGGRDLDTSHCFMGQERFSSLLELLPEGFTIIGLDEKTALVIEPATCMCHVWGFGAVTLLHQGHRHTRYNHPTSMLGDLSYADEQLAEIVARRGGHMHKYHEGKRFPLSEIGPFHSFLPEATFPPGLWQAALDTARSAILEPSTSPPAEVSALIQARQEARLASNWATADDLRLQISKLGWEVIDTRDGPMSRKLPDANQN